VTAGAPDTPKPSRWTRLRTLLPEVWALVRPRRALLAAGAALMAVNRVAGLVLPASTKVLLDDVVGQRRVELLLPLLGALAVASLVQGLTSLGLTQLMSKGAQRLISEMRLRLHGHLLRLPVSFYDGHKTGELVSRVMSDVEGLRNLIGTGMVELAGGLLTAALALLLMINISPRMTLLTAGGMVVFALLVWRAFTRIGPIYRQRGVLYGEVSGRLTESLGGVRVVKGYRAEEREHEVFAGGVHRLLDNVVRTLNWISALGLFSSVLIGLATGAVMYVGAREILAGRLTLGGFVTYTVLAGFVVGPMIQVVAVGSQLAEAMVGLERARELLGQRPEEPDPARVVEMGRVRGDVVFEHVHFAYAEGQDVLHGVSLQARAGTVTALVGPSGAGKSTLVGLVAAFHSPTAGTVRVDGVDLATVTLASYRSQLGVVLQETFLFDGTIRENVRFGRPQATAEEVQAACRVARVDEFAERMDKGYDTVVGERGVKLSMGQRQRVAIARALLADPRILILDEATSSLDTESEQAIQAALGRLLAGRTTFAIAHRLSTIRRADQILVVEQGRIVERGTHEELIALGGRYREMHARQQGLGDIFLAPGEGAAPPAEGQPEAPPAGEDAGLLGRLRRMGGG
jgi:subfamily B ATP-binding cassette protein MsbA